MDLNTNFLYLCNLSHKPYLTYSNLHISFLMNSRPQQHKTSSIISSNCLDITKGFTKGKFNTKIILHSKYKTNINYKAKWS